MPIVDSALVKATVQRDGSINVHERHTDDLGRTYDVVYNAAPRTDLRAMMAARVPRLDAEIEAAELAKAEDVAAAQDLADVRQAIKDGKPIPAEPVARLLGVLSGDG